MKKRTSSRVSKTDLKALHNMKDHQIKLSKEHPELDLKHLARARAQRVKTRSTERIYSASDRRRRRGVVQVPRTRLSDSHECSFTCI